jgi:hypothetical protein
MSIKQNIKFLIPILIFLSVFLILIMPAVSLAQADPNQGLIPCGRSPGPNVPNSVTKPCEFKDFMTLINNVIRFILFKMVVPIAAIMFAYAGVLLVTSGGSEEQKTKAKNIFTNVAIGLIIAIAAWLIIHTILLIVGYNRGSDFGF